MTFRSKDLNLCDAAHCPSYLHSKGWAHQVPEHCITLWQCCKKFIQECKITALSWYKIVCQGLIHLQSCQKLSGMINFVQNIRYKTRHQGTCVSSKFLFFLAGGSPPNFFSWRRASLQIPCPWSLMVVLSMNGPNGQQCLAKAIDSVRQGRVFHVEIFRWPPNSLGSFGAP